MICLAYISVMSLEWTIGLLFCFWNMKTKPSADLSGYRVNPKIHGLFFFNDPSERDFAVGKSKYHHIVQFDNLTFPTSFLSES